MLHEASEHRERGRLAALTEATTSDVLEQVRVVMADVEVGDTDLVDLYGNKGAADPGLVATVLARAAAQGEYLFPDGHKSGPPRWRPPPTPALVSGDAR